MGDTPDVRKLERDAAGLAEHLRLALAAGHLGTWRWDLATGETTWDDAMFSLFGIEAADFDGTYDAWRSRLHPDDADGVVTVVDRAVAEKSSYEIEHRVRWPDGSVRWIEGRGTVVLDESGTVLGTIGCCSDVTERKLIEEANRREAAAADRRAIRESRQRERLEFLVELNDVALHAIDHRDLMHRAASAAVPRLGDWCTVHFVPHHGADHEVEVAHVDPEKLEWARALRQQYPIDPDAVFGVPAVMRSGRTEFFAAVDRYLRDPSIVDIAVEVPAALRALVEVLGVTSIITVPLLTKRGVIGAMQFVTTESHRRYGDDDVALAEAAAGRIAGALDNAWHSEQQRDIAATLQAALLPIRLPTIPGVQVAVRYWAAGVVSEVGGDFCDVFPIDDSTWAVVIGDVCGTGAEAAAITAIARHTIRAAASHGASPVEVIEWVNAAVLAEGSGRFCTLVYCSLSRCVDGGWIATTVVGGHPLPIIVRADGTTESLGVHGTLVGALERVRATAIEQALGAGDVVVLHTDGVNDVRAPHALDDDQLSAMVTAAVAGGADDADGVTADDIAERLGGAIEAILPIPERNDDVAIVVLRVT